MCSSSWQCSCRGWRGLKGLPSCGVPLLSPSVPVWLIWWAKCANLGSMLRWQLSAGLTTGEKKSKINQKIFCYTDHNSHSLGRFYAHTHNHAFINICKHTPMQTPKHTSYRGHREGSCQRSVAGWSVWAVSPLILALPNYISVGIMVLNLLTKKSSAHQISDKPISRLCEVVGQIPLTKAFLQGTSPIGIFIEKSRPQ